MEPWQIYKDHLLEERLRISRDRNFKARTLKFGPRISLKKIRNFKVMKSKLLDREEFKYEIQYINSTYEIRKKSS